MFKKDPYNKALQHYRKLRRYPLDSAKYEKALLNVIRLCKESLRKNKRDGDAHVLLANAYFLASKLDFPSDNYSRYLPLAAAIIFEWKSTPMYTKSKENGEIIYKGVNDDLDREFPDWYGVIKPEGTLEDMHSRYYKQALV